MYMRVVSMRIKPEQVEIFKQASVPGIEALLAEPGVVSSALLQQVDDPTHFYFIEAYTSREAFEAHMQSACFLDWQQAVAPLLAREMEAVAYAPVYPPEDEWMLEPKVD